MFNKAKLQTALEAYRKNFTPDWWRDEKYKWIAVQSFHDNWQPKAENFPEMLEKSIKPAKNLLKSQGTFAAKTIVELAGFAPEKVRAMFEKNCRF